MSSTVLIFMLILMRFFFPRSLYDLVLEVVDSVGRIFSLDEEKGRVSSIPIYRKF